MAKTTVLSVIARLNVGGPAQTLTAVLDGLPDDRFDQVLAVGAPDDGEEDWVALRAPWLADDPRVRRIPSLGRPVRPRQDNAAYRQLRSLIRYVKPDIVHTHTAKAGMLGRVSARREGVPATVHTFHGHLLQGYFNTAPTAGVRLVERQLAGRTDALLSVGARVRDELLDAGIGRPERYVVVPPGVPEPAQHEPAAARAALGLPTDRPIVAFVARLTDVKRPDRLLEVAERVASQMPDAIFVVGGGAEPDELDRLWASVERADVRFFGWIADVGQIYAAADLVLLTSDAEGMPVSLIEAGLCGRACVASDVGSVGEVVLDSRTGRVVPPDATALADAVIELLRDDERRDLYGAAARHHTREVFSLDRLIDTTEQVYDAVLAGGPLPGGPPAAGFR